MTQPPWWRGAVIYEIYPRSFSDSNADGIGDLQGIIDRLDYVAGLGVDAIWIAPFFKSPMADFGYDVADYRSVDPMFGSMDDFDRLLARAHGLGLKVIIDQVLSHTSNEHAWFRESRASRDNPKSDWYVWADPKQDGTPPNNWLSIFGGVAWRWEPRRRWDINPGGNSTVIVGVIDSGPTTVATTLERTLWTGSQFQTVSLPFAVSPDLDAARFVAPRDLTLEPGPVVLDYDGHGTHVASTIAQNTNNGAWLAGMAYNVRILPVKVCAGFWELMLERAALGVRGYIAPDVAVCFTDEIAAGIRYAADNGARVINVSLGGEEASPLEREAILYAIDQGAFITTAMGNEYEFGNRQHFPAGYAPAIDGLMSVGAVGKSRARAYYSSTGNHLEIVAPGGNDLDVGGEDDGFVWQVSLFPPDQNPLFSPRPRFDRYVAVGYIGTSMATPHVSAAAALLMSQGIRDPRAIEAVIRATALDLGPAGKDDQYGFGLIQPRTALFGRGIAR
jgi:subtilisin family serine protease